MKTIIVACGGGIATSGTIATKINTRLAEDGLANQAKCEPIDIKQIELFLSSADLYVSIMPVRGQVAKYDIPTVNGMPLLTGVGADACYEQIKKLLGL